MSDEASKNGGREYWRSLEELADTPEFREALHHEFPEGASDLLDPVSRRTFAKLMGASLALAGVTACTRQPAEKIVPYVKQPEEILPGKPLYYATAMPMAGYAAPLLVESHEGHPTKIEGNPDHPVSRGATDVFSQASILGLYDPDRTRTFTYRGDIRPWNDVRAALKAAADASRGRGGDGVRLLTGSVTSPTLASQIRRLQAELPNMVWHQWEPTGRDQAREGARLAFGEYVDAQYILDQAQVILALDADVLGGGPLGVKYAREFAARRRVTGGRREMNRLYVAEPTPSVTGSIADHRLPLQAGLVGPFALSLAAALGVPGATPSPAADRFSAWIAPLSRDLQRHRGSCVVIAGDDQPAAVHAVVHAINQALDNVGRTVVYTEPVEANPIDQLSSLRQLAADMGAGKVETLVVIDANPLYTAPADLHFDERLMGQVRLRVHLGLYHDETAAYCHWQVPAAHYLESWSDARAGDGTVTLIQPLVAPLYDGRTPHDIVGALLSSDTAQSSHDAVRAYWQERTKLKGDDFEKFWRRALHDGMVAGTAAPEKAVTARPVDPASIPGGGKGREIVFRADASAFDGRFANNGWLQELPRPQTKLTWDNAALVSPATAARLGVENHQVVELGCRGRTVRAPIWILPGQAPDSITVHLGYGRRRVGQVGEGAGFDAYALRTSLAPGSDYGLAVRSTGDRHRLVSAQIQQTMEGRAIVRFATLEGFKKDPEFAHRQVEKPSRSTTLYPGLRVHGLRVGDVDRPEHLHRLQRVHGGLPVREQHRRRGPRPGGPRAQDALDPGRSVPHRRRRAPDHLQPARAVHAVRERAVRTRLPGRGHVAQHRGAERHGLQPLRGHALLLEQLPLQGAAVQLLPVPGLDDADAQDDAQPRRHGAEPRRHGEVHLLRPADQRGEDRGREGRPQGPRWRHRHRLRGGVSHAGHRVRGRQRPREPRREAQDRAARLRAPRGPEHAAAHDLPGGAPEPEPRDARCRAASGG